MEVSLWSFAAFCDLYLVFKILREFRFYYTICVNFHQTLPTCTNDQQLTSSDKLSWSHQKCGSRESNPTYYGSITTSPHISVVVINQISWASIFGCKTSYELTRTISYQMLIVGAKQGWWMIATDGVIKFVNFVIEKLSMWIKNYHIQSIFDNN